MNSVKGKWGRRRRGQAVEGGELIDEQKMEAWADWEDETPESQQLRLALIQAGRTAMPRHDPARLDRVFRRILAQLQDEERDGVPARRIDSPSGVTVKTFG